MDLLILQGDLHWVEEVVVVLLVFRTQVSPLNDVVANEISHLAVQAAESDLDQVESVDPQSE